MQQAEDEVDSERAMDELIAAHPEDAVLEDDAPKPNPFKSGAGKSKYFKKAVRRREPASKGVRADDDESTTTSSSSSTSGGD